jgi:hypothetical protein
MINKRALIKIEEAVHGVLSPLGFKKQKSNWRRRLAEVLQQFTIDSVQIRGKHRPEWGLNLLNRSENPAPIHYRLDVRWIAEMIIPHRRMLRIFDALDTETEMPHEQREKALAELLGKYVLPCFEMYQTEASVRAMMGNYKAPLRAPNYSPSLPRAWWPKD